MNVAETPKSAKEAFENNAIPAVRVLEKQLRAGIVRDKERLRALVGGNYRDLLSTAEEIVVLDQRTKEAETKISNLGQQCRPPQLEISKRTVSAFSSTSAQLRLLVQCITYASTALQARSTLLCAQLTVIARLLLKSLGTSQSSPQATNSLGDKVAVLRRRLLRLVRSQLIHPGSTIEVLVHAVCAYCLVTSASSSDAVKHFRDTRLEKLRQRIEKDGKDRLQLRESFRYLVLSVQTLKSLLGRSVNDALTLLQKQPILQDQHIQKLETLDIDRLQNLIPEDILDFTPYIKRVLLKQDEVELVLSEWVQEAAQLFAKGLQDVLGTTKSVAEVFTLRRDLCSIVLPVYFSTPAQESLLQTVRSGTNLRVLELCKTQTEALARVGYAITSSEATVVAGSTLWDRALSQRQLPSNSASYVRQIQASHLGTEGSLFQCAKKMKHWSKQMAQLRSQIQALESTRWQDILEEPDDDDEDTAQIIINQLSKEDPKKFTDAMNTCMRSAMSEFNRIMHDAAIQATQANEKGESELKRIVYLVRALRQSTSILSKATHDTSSETSELASKLHTALAEHIAERIKSSLTGLDSGATTVVEDLPSPYTFQLLRSICNIMADVGGTDIWSAAAVSKLKDRLRADLLEGNDRPVGVLNELDECFLKTALSENEVNPKGLATSDVDSRAIAYWQRTRLLFGVLSQ